MNRLKQFVTRLRRPDTREVAVAQVSDKYSEYPSNGLTPVKLAEIFREADAGDVLRQMELFEEMEEKTRICSVSSRRARMPSRALTSR